MYELFNARNRKTIPIIIAKIIRDFSIHFIFNVPNIISFRFDIEILLDFMHKISIRIEHIILRIIANKKKYMPIWGAELIQN